MNGVTAETKAEFTPLHRPRYTRALVPAGRWLTHQVLDTSARLRFAGRAGRICTVFLPHSATATESGRTLRKSNLRWMQVGQSGFRASIIETMRSAASDMRKESNAMLPLIRDISRGVDYLE